MNSAFGKRSVTLDAQQMNEANVETRSKRQVPVTDVYEQLARFSGGQILNIRTNEISDLASLIGFSARQSRSTIFYRSDNLFGTVQHYFPVDSFTDEAIISISGESITVSVYSPDGKSHINFNLYYVKQYF